MMQGSTAEADPYAAALRLEAPAERARAPARLLLPDGGPGALDGARLRLDAPWPLCIVVTEVRALAPQPARSRLMRHRPFRNMNHVLRAVAVIKQPPRGI